MTNEERAKALTETLWPDTDISTDAAFTENESAAELAAALDEAEARGAEKEREEILSLIPQNWLDPMLTGNGAAFKSEAAATTNVERVLNRLKLRIEARVEK